MQLRDYQQRSIPTAPFRREQRKKTAHNFVLTPQKTAHNFVLTL